ncbi:MAG: hypothetical protein AB7K52_14180 [Phycisphaerales bacterium]
MPEPAPAPSRLFGLPWAAFLACSWTWCIGMFLPVLLLRDFGPGGFVVFAVPNVLGAAAMGWVLTRPSSDALLRAHAPAAAAFSIVTIAFHGLFITQPIQWLKQYAGVGELWSVPVLLIVAGVACFDRHARAAVLTLLLSLSAFAVFAVRTDLPLAESFIWPAALAAHLPALALVCLFGFALCPYLDLTFHRALRGAGPYAPAAFTLGFGVLFFAMILFTFRYAPTLVGRSPGRAALAIVCAHMLLQAAYTVGVHARALLVEHSSPLRRLFTFIVLAACLAAALLDISGGSTRGGPAPVAIQPGFEFLYRLFMGCYGLLFPAYVFLCILPRRDDAPVDQPRARLVWLAACALASPCYWLGFIERQTWWLVPGVLIVLVARLAVRRSAAAPSGSPSRPSTLHSP